MITILVEIVKCVFTNMDICAHQRLHLFYHLFHLLCIHTSEFFAFLLQLLDLFHHLFLDFGRYVILLIQKLK